MKTLAIITLLSLVFISSSLSAQDLVSSGGKYLQSSNISLSGTLGEPIIKTIGNQQFKLSQGFQQSNLVATAINKIQKSDFSLSVYPNPIVAYLNIDIKEGHAHKLAYSLIDISGRELVKRKVNSSLVEVDMQAYKSGIYLLNIYKQNGDPIQNFRIVKK